MAITVRDIQSYQGKPVILMLTNAQQVSGTVVQIASDSIVIQTIGNSNSQSRILLTDILSVSAMTFRTSGLTADQIQPFVGHQVKIIFTSNAQQVMVIGTVQSVDAANVYLSVNNQVSPIPLSVLWSIEGLGTPQTTQAGIGSKIASFANTTFGKILILGAVGTGGWLVGKNWDSWTEHEEEEEESTEEDGKIEGAETDGGSEEIEEK
jgi:small nuclear ribonucleoprotein (snRNP)-like protein